MDTMKIVLAAIMALSVIISLYWGTVLSLWLPEIDERFDRKPFNCRPCLTFHILVIISSLNALITNSITFFAISLVVAFIVFFIIKFIDNKKITR